MVKRLKLIHTLKWLEVGSGRSLTIFSERKHDTRNSPFTEAPNQNQGVQSKKRHGLLDNTLDLVIPPSKEVAIYELVYLAEKVSNKVINDLKNG